MTDITRKKHTGEAGNGGQFGSKANSEAETSLSAAGTTPFRDVTIAKKVRIGALSGPVPEWPAGMPEPEISFDINGAGEFEATYWFNDADRSYSFWGNPSESWENNIESDPYWGNDWAVDGVSEEEFIAWAEATTGRMRNNYSSISAATTFDEETSQAIIDNALGKPQAFDDDLTQLSAKATKRADDALRAWGDYENEPDTVLSDALADLRHWADARGVNFDEVINRSHGCYREELDEQQAALATGENAAGDA